MVYLEIECSNCGKYFHRYALIAKARIRNFCSYECYWGFIHNPNYLQNRHGQRIGRKKISKYFSFSKKNVVHHKDGNDLNNEISNLAVFKDHGHHMNYHRGGTAKPIWDGEKSVPHPAQDAPMESQEAF
jgi:hypothetical protein